MNLCYVLDSWPRLSETFVRRELAIAARDHEVGIVALQRTGEAVDEPEAAALDSRVAVLGSVESPSVLGAALAHPVRFVRAASTARRARIEGTGRRFRDLVRVAQALRLRRVDRIHAHFARWSTAAAEVLSAFSGIPFGFTAHAYDLFDDPVRFAQKAHDASWVVTCSAYGGAEARRLAPDDAAKIVTIRHGLDLATWTPGSAPRVPGPLRVLAVGRVLPIKGFDVLVEAVHRLVERRIATEVRIIGGGEATESIESLVRARALGDVVRLEGPRSPADVRAAMRDWCDVFVVPSRRDRLPNTIAEAFACGRPVIATTVGGIRELVDGDTTGLLVPPDDVPALVDALVRIEGDALLRTRMGAAGRARVEAIFDGEKNVKALLDVIESAGGTRVR